MLTLLLCSLLAANDEGWIDLTGTDEFAAWKASGQWYRTTEVGTKPGNSKLLEGKPVGGPILVNSPLGKTVNLVTKANFRDVEFSCDFMMGEKSNAGVKFIGHYEIQLFDSYGKKASELTGSDCGGVYPRGEGKPKYHVIDRGTPPKQNVCKKPGEWQSLQITFRAPRFDSAGKKIENASFVKVVMNGVTIHENIELRFPTGSAWRQSKEVPEGPILLQGDHGPVAFRNIMVRKIEQPDGVKQ
jgi:hypothetical protein